ncbi:MAG: prepilin-type N-terminal cleavage/methylation domain-containing protein [Candidatus Omnitrophota bacterium]
MEKRKVTTGFTLIEVIVVVIIVSILVSLSVPLYNRTLERSRDYEAKSNLKLIQAAEEIYRTKNGFYYPNSPGETDINAINLALGLNLNERYWDYIVESGVNVFSAGATRLPPTGGFNRGYSIDNASSEPLCSGNCP